jgi:hypothetical protein
MGTGSEVDRSGGLVGIVEVAVAATVRVIVSVTVGVAVGVALGVGVSVALGAAVGVTLGVAVSVALGVAVSVALGVTVGVALGVAVKVALGVAEGGIRVGAAGDSLLWPSPWRRAQDIGKIAPHTARNRSKQERRVRFILT